MNTSTDKNENYFNPLSKVITGDKEIDELLNNESPSTDDLRKDWNAIEKEMDRNTIGALKASVAREDNNQKFRAEKMQDQAIKNQQMAKKIAEVEGERNDLRKEVERTKALLSTMLIHLTNQLVSFEAMFNPRDPDGYSYEYLDEYIEAATFVEKNFGKRKGDCIDLVKQMLAEKTI